MSATKALSGSVSLAGGPLTAAGDDAAFQCEIADRITGRSQTIVRGQFTNLGFYKTGGVLCDLAKLLKPGRFPLNNYRIAVQLDSTANYYAVYDHTNKKLLIYSALGTQVTNGTNVNALIFPFLAVGE